MGKFSIRKMPSDILKIVAQNVSELRKEQDLTQQQLAEKADVSYGSIKRFERSGQISFASLLKIAEALGRLSEFESLFQPPLASERLKNLFD